MFQRVLKNYQGWSEDSSTTFTIFFTNNTVVQLDLREQRIGPWKILPLVNPAQVSDGLHTIIVNFAII